MRSVEAILLAAGSRLDLLLQLTVYIADMSRWGAVNEPLRDVPVDVKGRSFAEDHGAEIGPERAVHIAHDVALEAARRRRACRAVIEAMNSLAM